MLPAGEEKQFSEIARITFYSLEEIQYIKDQGT